MSKIVFLLMSCNNEFFQHQEELVKSTWLKPIIDGEYKNIDYYFYTSGDKACIKDHKIYVESDDDWFSTFPKTKLAFQALNDNGIDYDYIIRVNLSTYVNVKLLLLFMKVYIEHNNDQHVWGTDLLCHSGTPYLIGKFLILPKSRVEQTLNCDPKFDTQKDADDYVFGCMFNDERIYRCFEPFYALPNRYVYGKFSHDINSNDFDWADACSHIALSYRTYMDGKDDYEIRAKNEDYACHVIHEHFKDYMPSLEDTAKLMKYSPSIITHTDLGTLERYKYPCCVLIYISNESPLEDDLRRLTAIFNDFKDDYDMFLMFENDNKNINACYEATNNYPFNIMHMKTDIDNMLLNVNTWAFLHDRYKYVCVIKDLNHDVNKGTIDKYVSKKITACGNADGTVSIRNCNAMYMLTSNNSKDTANMSEWEYCYTMLSDMVKQQKDK